MQNISEIEEKNNLKLYRVTILLEPITESLWYEMKREQQNLPALSEANKLNCSFCLEEFEPTSTFAKCLDCEQTQVLICIECLRLGMESHPHTRNHRYSLCDSIGPKLIDEGPNSWGAQEDLQLLNSLMNAHLNQWPELSKDWGKKRTLREAMDRLDRAFIRSQIGEYVLKKYTRGFVKEWNEEENGDSNELQPVPSTSSQASMMENIVNEKYGAGTPSKTPSTEKIEELMNGGDLNGISHHLFQKRRAYFDEEESSNPDLGEIGERRMSTRSIESTSNSNAIENRKVRKEQKLAAAKNEAAEALRGKMRKTSLELSEAINFEVNGFMNNSQNGGNKKKKDKKNNKMDLLSPQNLIEFFAYSNFNPHFSNFPPPPMDSHTIAKFDEEDLQLLTYSPFRVEFENEYKNEAEQLISRIQFPRENAERSEVEEFLNEVRYARFNRYNRLMRIRLAKKNAILEHNLLGEYLGIVKTNISEKGKYVVFADRYFSVKSKEDIFRHIFCQMRQLADKETINQLAKDIGAMETLKDQIDELKTLQRKGVTKLKGRLKTDSAPILWSKKRKSKNKKAKENSEQRKAGLRWKRIKRWTKRNHLQNVVEADQEEEEDENEEE